MVTTYYLWQIEKMANIVKDTITVNRKGNIIQVIHQNKVLFQCSINNHRFIRNLYYALIILTNRKMLWYGAMLFPIFILSTAILLLSWGIVNVSVSVFLATASIYSLIRLWLDPTAPYTSIAENDVLNIILSKVPLSMFASHQEKN